MNKNYDNGYDPKVGQAIDDFTVEKEQDCIDHRDKILHERTYENSKSKRQWN